MYGKMRQSLSSRTIQRSLLFGPPLAAILIALVYWPIYLRLMPLGIVDGLAMLSRADLEMIATFDKPNAEALAPASQPNARLVRTGTVVYEHHIAVFTQTHGAGTEKVRAFDDLRISIRWRRVAGDLTLVLLIVAACGAVWFHLLTKLFARATKRGSETGT